MKKRVLMVAMVTTMVCLTACSGKKELGGKKDVNVVESVDTNEADSDSDNIKIDKSLSEGNDTLVKDYYNEGIDYKNNVIFNPDQNKFVKMENNTYVDLEQNYKEAHITVDDFEDDIKWYYCKDGNRLLYKQDIDPEENTSVYIVTEATSGDTYLLLCKNNTHTGYSWQYPVKFNVETGEYEDVFASATINNKSVKEYGYLKNWQITESNVKVDCNETFLEPESQVWRREIVTDK